MKVGEILILGDVVWSIIMFFNSVGSTWNHIKIMCHHKCHTTFCKMLCRRYYILTLWVFILLVFICRHTASNKFLTNFYFLSHLGACHRLMSRSNSCKMAFSSKNMIFWSQICDLLVVLKFWNTFRVTWNLLKHSVTT